MLLLGGIWWWGARRARLSPKNTERRDVPAVPAVPASDLADDAPAIRPDEQSREWGVPPFEPLSIRTADFEQLEPMDLPMSATSDPLDVTLNMDYVAHETAAQAHAPPEAHAPSDEIEPVGLQPEIGVELDDVVDRSEGRGTAPHVTFAEPPPQAPDAGEMQRIVTIRVSALGETRWSGTDLLAALEDHGLGFGRYKVFHRKHNDGRTLFCAASLVEPGTFDRAGMPQEEFRGLTLFAVLPGPADPLYTIDALIATAGDLAEALDGIVQDSNGAPLSPQRAEALREDVARFGMVGHGRAGTAE